MTMTMIYCWRSLIVAFYAAKTVTNARAEEVEGGGHVFLFRSMTVGAMGAGQDITHTRVQAVSWKGEGGLFIKYNKTCFDTNGWVKGGANCGYWIQNGGDNRGGCGNNECHKMLGLWRDSADRTCFALYTGNTWGEWLSQTRVIRGRSRALRRSPAQTTN